MLVFPTSIVNSIEDALQEGGFLVDKILNEAFLQLEPQMPMGIQSQGGSFHFLAIGEDSDFSTDLTRFLFPTPNQIGRSSIFQIFNFRKKRL
jgi:hypothetical protein